MTSLNHLLEEQIAHFFPDKDALPENLKLFIKKISSTYDDFEKKANERFSEKGVQQDNDGKQYEDRIAQLEKELIKQKEHLDTTQQLVHTGSWELDLTIPRDSGENPWYATDEVFRILGYEPSSILLSTENFYSRVPTHEHEFIQEVFQQAIETGSEYNIEHSIILPDGIEKIVNELSRAIFDERTGKPVRVFGTMQDITERKKTEKLMQNAIREKEVLLENIGEVIFSFDIENNICLQVSAACEDTYGYPAEDFYKNPMLWFDVVVDDDKYIIQNDMRYLSAGQAVTSACRIHHKNGSIRWIEAKLEPTLGFNGKLIRIDGVCSDITDRKEAETALRKSEHKFRTLLESSSDAVTIINERAEIVYASDSFSRITGYTPQEVIGTSSMNTVHPDDIKAFRTFLVSLLSNPGKTSSITYRLRRKDSSYVWCERVATNLIHDPDLNGIVSNFRDITNQKDYEETLLAYNGELKKINMELDRFVYSASHDLRAPLASVLGIVNLIGLETTDYEIQNGLSLIKKSILKLDGFILDILDYSKNSRLDIIAEEIDLSEILANVTNNMRFMDASFSNVEIITTINKDAAFYSDPNRVKVILSNLISNAIRYKKPDILNPSVEIVINISEERGQILVKDNGIGIAKENHQKIFEMFSRISKKSVGSGLGLYIVKETVHKLNGTIRVESQLGQGTEMIVSLPNLHPKKSQQLK